MITRIEKISYLWEKFTERHRIFFVLFTAMILGYLAFGLFGQYMNNLLVQKFNQSMTLIWSLIGFVILATLLSLIGIIIKLLAKTMRLSLTDSTTGIRNLHFLSEIAPSIVARANRNAEFIIAFFIDMNFMKKINDTYGHSAGDQALLELVRAIKKIIRDYDVFLRYGGDEFVVIMTMKELGDATKFLSRMRESLCPNNPLLFSYRKEVIEVCASVGLAYRYSQQDEPAETQLLSLIKEADADMYQQKELYKRK